MGIKDEAAIQLGKQIVDLVMLAFNDDAIKEVPESSIRTGHLIRMKRFIDVHLSDSSLAPATVAAAACISPRYAHQLFATEENTISGYIMDCRLARCEENVGGAATRQSHDFGNRAYVGVSKTLRTLATCFAASME